ncbi:CPBP family intramembrane glutamic endopeptidase [Nonomuraea angiospora]|uniref:CPBP family intramembrane glutamic endopeptidase n=1 Tax=Nonomuraea angiospora TaxID=46172 RepID=UPI00344DD8BF
MSRLRGRLLLGFGVRSGLAGELGKGFLIVAAAMIALFGALVAAGGTTVTGSGLRADVLGNGLAAFLSWAVLEEVSRMGLLLALLALTRRPWLALAVSSLAFGAVHLLDDGTLLGAASSTLGGLMYGLALLRTGRMWMPIAMHFAWNFVQGSILGYPVSGEHRLGVLFLPEHDVVGGLLTLHDNGPELLTGGAYGPEGGIPSLVARALIILAVLAATRRPAHVPLLTPRRHAEAPQTVRRRPRPSQEAPPDHHTAGGGS